MTYTVTTDTNIAELIEYDPGCAQLLMAAGMHCIGCFAAQMESLGEACEVHGLDAEDMVELLNEYLKSRENDEEEAAEKEEEPA